MIKTITDLGDASLLLPACAILFLVLLATNQRTAARAWALSVAVCIATVVIAKLGFEAWGSEVPALHIRSPSGHIALSATFYGGIAMLLAGRRSFVLCLAAWFSAAALVIAIAATRLMLHLHTPEEIAVAFVIGGGSLAVLATSRPADAQIALPWAGLACVFTVLAVATHGHDLTAEPELIRIARQL